jgi:hydroxymethylbilane synthase
VECRADDDRTRAALAAIDDPTVGPLVTAERAYLAELGGGCTLPVGAHAVWTDADPMDGGTGRSLRLAGLLASDDGRIVLRHRQEGTDPDVLGRTVARYLLEEAGGADLGAWSPSTGTDGMAPSVAT